MPDIASNASTHVQSMHERRSISSCLRVSRGMVSQARTSCKAAKQVEGGGCLVVGLHQPGRVWDTRICGELLAVDDVTPALPMHASVKYCITATARRNPKAHRRFCSRCTEQGQPASFEHDIARTQEMTFKMPGNNHYNKTFLMPMPQGMMAQSLACRTGVPCHRGPLYPLTWALQTAQPCGPPSLQAHRLQTWPPRPSGAAP